MSQDEAAIDATAKDAPDLQQTNEALTNQLSQLKAAATQQYALKNYTAAAESFSEAAEIQANMNGEMAVENAELLYQYGRCLYHVGVSKSDVLGGRVAQQEEPIRKRRKVTQHDTETFGGADQNKDIKKPELAPKTNGSAAAASKPFFQITGDENWTDSEDEGDDVESEDDEEDDDDLAIAYEILDSARVLYNRRIESLESGGGQGLTQELRSVKERLADTHDLQAEIKLENEQFTDAVNDAQQALAYKLQLYPQESGLVAEAHYKLSIALDFAALPVSTGEDGQDGAAEGTVDEDMRKQAAEEMEKAIMSCQARIRKEEAELSTLEGTKLESLKRSIADARDLVKDMKNRLVDLRNPVVNAANEVDELNDSGVLQGLLAGMLGQSKAEKSKMLAQATANANDLSGLIKQKKKPKSEPVPDTSETVDKGKRKLDAVAEGDADDPSKDKKVKFEVDA